MVILLFSVLSWESVIDMSKWNWVIITLRLQLSVKVFCLGDICYLEVIPSSHVFFKVDK